jgi:hypothetical protein
MLLAVSYGERYGFGFWAGFSCWRWASFVRDGVKTFLHA